MISYMFFIYSSAIIHVEMFKLLMPALSINFMKLIASYLDNTSLVHSFTS